MSKNFIHERITYEALAKRIDDCRLEDILPILSYSMGELVFLYIMQFCL
jgi:hypothetical protein